MQNQYGTDKIKAIIVILIADETGTPVVKCSWGGQLVKGGTVALGPGRYLFQLADGLIVLPGGINSSGDTDHNTAVVVGQVRNNITAQSQLTDVTFGPITGSVASALGGYTVNAGQIEIDFGASGGTNPADGALLTFIFYGCRDGVTV